jgi:zinc protease
MKRLLAILQIAALLASSATAAEVKVVAPQVADAGPGAVGAGLGRGNPAAVQPLSLNAPLITGQGLPSVSLTPSAVAPAATLSNTALPVAEAKTLSKPVQAVPEKRISARPSVHAPNTLPEGEQYRGAPAPSAIAPLVEFGPQAKEVAQVQGAADSKEAADIHFQRILGGEAAPLPASAAQTELQPQVSFFGRLMGRLLPSRKTAAEEPKTEPPVPQAAEPAQPANEDSRELVLDNGMHVQLIRDPSLFSATLAVGYEVGGRDGPYGESGYAHFLEHLMFQGTKRVRNWFKMIGAMGGYTNAWTYQDHTLYVHSLPMNVLELGISLEAERMTSLEITPEKVEREKRVILEEKAGRDNSALEASWNELFRQVFSNPKSQRTVIGTEEDVQNATAFKLQRYYDEYYTPDRAKVVIWGNIDLDQTEAWVRDYLGGVPGRKAKAAAPDLSEKEQTAPRRSVVLDPYVTDGAVLLGWKAPARGDPAYYALSVLTEMLQARLHRRLVLERKEAAGVSLSVPYLDREPVAVTGSILLGPGLEEEAALAALEAELASIGRGEFTSDEFRWAYMKPLLALNNELGDSYSGALLLAKAAVRGLDAKTLQEDAGKFAQVTREAVQAAVRLLSPEKRSIVSVRPDDRPAAKKPAKAGHEHQPQVDSTPTPDEENILRSLARMEWTEVDFKTPEQFRLPNGLKVIVMPDGRRSTVFAKLAFRLGETAVDPLARQRMSMAAALLRLRTGARAESELNDALRALGGWVSVSQMYDNVVLNASAPSEAAGGLLELLAEMAGKPHAWTDEELAPWKALWKAGARDSSADPAVASHQRAIEDLIGGHPSARASLTPEAVESLSAADLARYFKAHFSPDNAVLVIAGDVNPEQLKTELSAAFGAWEASGQAPVKGPDVVIRRQDGVSFVDRPGSEQAFIRVSGLLPGAGDPQSPDHYPLLVASEIMGGGWGSRLYQVARQAMGLAYNAFSNVIRDPALGMWTFGLSSRPEKAQLALKALLDQAELMRSRPPSEFELASAKNGLIGSFLMSLDHIGDIADHLLGLELFGAPLEDWGLRVRKFSDVTGEQVRRVSEELLAQDKTAVTVVGDKRALEELEEVRPSGLKRLVSRLFGR